MFKVTSLSIVVYTNQERTTFDEEKEERILPSTVPHIQNHMVNSS